MMSFFEIMNMFSKNNNIPPIMRGTKAMIKRMVAEERKIEKMNKINAEKRYSMVRPKEDISKIFTKYVNKDFNKDAYLFIK